MEDLSVFNTFFNCRLPERKKSLQAVAGLFTRCQQQVSIPWNFHGQGQISRQARQERKGSTLEWRNLSLHPLHVCERSLISCQAFKGQGVKISQHLLQILGYLEFSDVPSFGRFPQGQCACPRRVLKKSMFAGW
jgi:hypothetical protein